MDRRTLTLILMLVAGAVTCIITLVQEYSVLGSLTALLIVFITFYFLGCVLKWTLDYFDKQNEKLRKEEADRIAAEETKDTLKTAEQ